MGKTVESYRIALEEEISRWNGFARALRTNDREAFEELMDMCRSYVLEGSDSTAPVVFELMAISILVAQAERIGILEKELAAIKPDVVKPLAIQESPVTITQEPKIHFRKALRGSEQTRLA